MKSTQVPPAVFNKNRRCLRRSRCQATQHVHRLLRQLQLIVPAAPKYSRVTQVQLICYVIDYICELESKVSGKLSCGNLPAKWYNIIQSNHIASTTELGNEKQISTKASDLRVSERIDTSRTSPEAMKQDFANVRTAYVTAPDSSPNEAFGHAGLEVMVRSTISPEATS